jgi:biopolymer transport protein ExbD
MKRRKRFGKRAPANQEMTLNITSMADIFTILLVFLLKSFSTSVSSITPSSEVQLPEVAKADQLQEALKLEISRDAILMDDKKITQLEAFEVPIFDQEGDGTPRSLNAALIAQRRKNTLQKFPRLMILADQEAPYSTVKRVLASASQSGFAEFKLVVVEAR